MDSATLALLGSGPSKSKKRKKIVMLLVSFLFGALVLGGGAFAAYWFAYRDDEDPSSDRPSGSPSSDPGASPTTPGPSGSDTYEWRARQDWSDCTRTCGGGTRTQTVECLNQNGTVVNDSFCDANAKPSTTDECNAHLCPEPPRDCQYTPWSSWTPGCPGNISICWQAGTPPPWDSGSKQTRTRQIKHPAIGQGTVCVGGSNLTQTRSCPPRDYTPDGDCGISSGVY